jgi:uncharacterized phage protein (TIGR02218 family)
MERIVGRPLSDLVFEELKVQINFALMAKNVPTALLNWLLTAIEYNRADCFTITLANGQSIYTTTAQLPVVIGTNTFYPARYGTWQRGSIQAEAAYSPKSNSMSLSVSVDPSFLPQIVYPGTQTPLMQTVAAGLFDAAKVTVTTIYWGLGESVATGVARGSVISFVGQVTKVSEMGRDKCDFEVADMLFQLNLFTPPNLIQSSCRHQLFDSGCTLLANNFKLANTAAAGSTALQINLSSGASTASWWNGVITFTQGYIIFTSGQNNGLLGYIKNLNSNTQILLSAPMPFPVKVGDTFNMFAGCNKSLVMCNNGFSNLLNFGGEPFVPNPELGL